MAITRSFQFVWPQVQLYNGSLTLDYGDTTPGAWMGALWTGAVTPNISQVDPTYGIAPWDAGEVSGSAPGYDVGGFALDIISFGELAGTPGKSAWLINPLLLTAATLTAEGLLIYRGVDGLAVTFRAFGQAYESADGDFEIAPDPVEGILRRGHLGPLF